MKIIPFPKHLHEAVKLNNIKTVSLHFSGGNDEGFLSVQTDPYIPSLESEIEDWAWTVYDYSGAGEGNDYGDDIVYDFENKEISHTEWYTSRVDEIPSKFTLKIEE